MVTLCLQVTGMVAGTRIVVVVAAVMAVVVVVVVTADLDRLGVKAIGNVTDAELTILLAEADAMLVDQTRHQKGVTAAETGVTVVEVVAATVIEEAVIEEAVIEAETTGVEEEEERQLSSLATGTAQTAAHTTLQAVKPATSAMLPSEKLNCESVL